MNNSKKWPRKEFRQLIAKQVIHVIDSGGGTDETLVLLTLALATLDKYRGAKVPLPIKIPGGDTRLSELTHPVAVFLAQEGVSLNEPRVHSHDFWVGVIEEAEDKLRGFSK